MDQALTVDIEQRFASGFLIAPSLAVGAGIGSSVAQLFSSAPLGAIMLLGMVAYFAGVVQAPITAFAIVTEMTNNHAMVVPLMATAREATSCARAMAAGQSATPYGIVSKSPSMNCDSSSWERTAPR